MVAMLWMLAVTGGMAVAVQSDSPPTEQRQRHARQAARMFRRGSNA